MTFHSTENKLGAFTWWSLDRAGMFAEPWGSTSKLGKSGRKRGHIQGKGEAIFDFTQLQGIMSRCNSKD